MGRRGPVCRWRQEQTALGRPGRLRVRVIDSGPGLSDEALAHVFEPFFTTKPAGVGLGLGLAISQDIVRDFGGELTAANHPGGGAVFTLELPTAGDPTS